MARAPSVGPVDAPTQPVPVPETGDLDPGVRVDLRNPDDADQLTEAVDDRWAAESLYHSEHGGYGHGGAATVSPPMPALMRSMWVLVGTAWPDLLGPGRCPASTARSR
jgi:hypothetical protein